jgi:hypothetical protein
MGNKHVNAPNIDAAQRGEANEQRQNVAESVVQRDPIVHQPLIK